MNAGPFKIGIVVHGRFIAFDLSRELIRQGHDVRLFTNYPKFIVQKFGIPKKRVSNLVSHGIICRLIFFLNRLGVFPDGEFFAHDWFSKWAEKSIAKEKWDAVLIFSGIAEDVFKALSGKNTIKFLIRGSAHIRTQSRLLKEEEQRAQSKIQRPSNWMIDREEREYELSDAVLVLSTFARDSFIAEGIASNKVRILQPGADIERFYPGQDVIDRRCQRIVSDEKLNVLMAGSFSFQKGVLDFLAIASFLSDRFNFQFVGSIDKETKTCLAKKGHSVELLSKQPEFSLPSVYAKADLFIFTTIQDGYAMVLAQAHASGLPVLATQNCAGPDLIEEGKTGWVLPIRNPDAFVKRLQWCDSHRGELSEMVRRIHSEFKPRGWAEAAQDLVRLCDDFMTRSAKKDE